MDAREIAEAFSGHRFEEAIPHLAPGVRWVLPGQGAIEGREAVAAACRESAAQMESLAAHDFVRFVAAGDGSVAAVDAVGRYVDAEGNESFVSSADVYELDAEGLVVTITSYTVEVGGPDPASAAPGHETDHDA
ncbi:nuclear transport factor 2 family protein [Phycicoccus avicenniae]|uniref:nuclear transport factor 2 family protein n=1 Tax=Phycicoccus avicenniae TaxID=2828860 RepID=UPI003D2CD0AD